MGALHSIFCSLTFCVERAATWLCCAFLLSLMLFVLLLLVVYGISVGYHYAQQELTSFALASRDQGVTPSRRMIGSDSEPAGNPPVVRLLAVDQDEVTQDPILEVYKTGQPGQEVYVEASQTPLVILETERPTQEPELSPHEREFAKRLIGRFRRSKNSTTDAPFFRPLRNNTALLRAVN